MPSILADATLPRTDCPTCGGTGKVIENLTVSDRLRQERLERGVSGREIARRMQISSAYLVQLELGQAYWTRRLVERYEAALDGEKG